MELRVSDDLAIDTDRFKDEGIRMAILARSGGGKSNLTALLLEQLISHGIQVCIIEPIKEYYTLKTMFNNIVWISDEGDIPIYGEAYSIYSKLLEDGANIILSVGDLEDEFQEKAFTASFLQSLYQRWKRVRRPLFLAIEEAEGFAPQLWAKEDRPCLAAISKLAKRGRKLGINMILATQRPAEIHKAVLSQANIIFLGGFKAARDLEAIKSYAKLLHLPINVNEISQFEAGEFYAIMLGEARKIKALLRRTPHGGETPLIQPLSRAILPTLEEAKKAVEEEMRRKKEEEDVIKKLMNRIQELEKENRELQEKLKMAQVIKEVPIEVKAEVTSIPVATSKLALEDVPEAVLKCPYRGCVKVYDYMRGKGYLRVGEISAGTGIGRDTVKKILKYLRRKGLVSVKTVTRHGKQYIVKARIEEKG